MTPAPKLLGRTVSPLKPLRFPLPGQLAVEGLLLELKQRKPTYAKGQW
jgi:hypothetical protein